MLTDWLIVRRLAAELDRALRGVRVRAAGRIAGGRFALRTRAECVVVDAFGETPLVTLEGPLSVEREAGWMRTMADALEGLRIERVRARHGDRLIAFDCSTRSRFGVESGYRFVVELVPRFGNVLLLKDDTIVSAAKEFTRAENRRRATIVGEPYEPPPLPAPEPGEGDLAAAFATLADGGDDAACERASRALRAAVPLLPKLVASSLVIETSRLSVVARVERCVERARAIVAASDGAANERGELYAYRAAGRLVQCHVVPLAQFSALERTREASLLPLLSEFSADLTATSGLRALDVKRAALRTRVERRRAGLSAERSALERERDDANARDVLRLQGELLYAHLGDVPAGAATFVPQSNPEVTIALDPALDAKANAAALFKRYRKATAKLQHVGARLEELTRDEQFAADLAWEIERADGETLGDVAESIDRLEHRKAHRQQTRGQRRPLDIRLADDARVYVGRSPRGNADLTFRLARPSDLWFHARSTPGAHVVLQIDSRRAPTPQELEAAATLAAYHSKARGSDKIAVDYTERKHVRRRQNAPPGLVWYTHARTLVVAPSPGGPAIERT